MEDFLSSLARQRGLQIHTIINEEWEKSENGTSALEAKKFLREDFILLMSDHLFEKEILVELIKETKAESKTLFAADFKIEDNRLNVVSKNLSYPGCSFLLPRWL